MRIYLLAFTFLLFACEKKVISPEITLKNFVDARVGQVVDRNFILERVTGKMLANFKAMNETELKMFWDMKNIQTESFKILHKSCQEQSCSLTYSIGYSTKNADKMQSISVVQKVAKLVQVDDKWLISDVQNISTSHENLEPINLLQP